jgi:hypothetical protein
VLTRNLPESVSDKSGVYELKKLSVTYFVWSPVGIRNRYSRISSRKMFSLNVFVFNSSQHPFWTYGPTRNNVDTTSDLSECFSM